MRYSPAMRTVRLLAAAAVLFAVAPSPGAAAGRSPAARTAGAARTGDRRRCAPSVRSVPW
ncbi:hypothetical protein PV350_20350 [Streptomyces sp. PA03-6a]|nr:hypothetical protein [Streptomyces sp. PA03-6a]